MSMLTKYTIHFTRPCPLGIVVGNVAVRGSMSLYAYDREGAERAARAVVPGEWCKIERIEKAEPMTDAQKVTTLRQALERAVDEMEESAILTATCPECTDGSVPDHLNRGLCGWHNALSVLRLIAKTEERNSGVAEPLRSIVNQICP